MPLSIFEPVASFWWLPPEQRAAVAASPMGSPRFPQGAPANVPPAMLRFGELNFVELCVALLSLAELC